MTDPRRKRHIKTPSGPRKKDEGDTSRFKMNPPPMGRTEVPKPKPKPDPSKEPRRDSRDGQQGQGNRGGRGRSQGGARGGRNGGQGRPRSGGARPQGRPQSRPERPKQLEGESWARVLEHNITDGVVTALSEKTFQFCRLKVKTNATPWPVNHRLYIGTDKSKRTEVADILGMAHRDKMSNMAVTEIPVLLEAFVAEHAQHFVDTFYNKAGPMSLKQHSYELLPDVGPVKARNMVKAREQVGMFASMDEFDRLCSIRGCAALAARFAEELEDPTLEPRLTALLLPVGA